MQGIKTYLRPQAAGFSDIGIQKFILHYEKYFNSGGDYVE
jgi:hypothetical protein